MTSGHLSLLSTLPAHRICLVDLGVDTVARCVIAFQACRAFRENHSIEITSAVWNSYFTHIAVIACDVLSHFAEAIGRR